MADSISRTVTKPEEINGAVNWVDAMTMKGLERGPVEITLGRPEKGRTSPQNSRYHAMMGDIRKQAVITMPGRRIVLADYDADECKALLVIWFANEREIQGDPLSKPPRTVMCPITGQSISIRPSTKDWGKKDASDFMEFLFALGADTGVQWSEPALKEYENYREATK